MFDKIENFEFKDQSKILGEGGFSKVYSALNKYNN